MIPLVEKGTPDDSLPEYLDLPQAIIEKYWSYWVLWRASGQRLDLANALYEVPAQALDVIFLLDDLYSKIETQHKKRNKTDVMDSE